jgi:hypothetical protein
MCGARIHHHRKEVDVTTTHLLAGTNWHIPANRKSAIWTDPDVQYGHQDIIRLLVIGGPPGPVLCVDYMSRNSGFDQPPEDNDEDYRFDWSTAAVLPLSDVLAMRDVLDSVIAAMTGAAR